MTDLDKLQEMIVKFNDDRDWNQFHNPKDTAISLVLESTEFLEHFQWRNKEEMAEHLKNKKADVSEELADVFYWVLLIAHELDIKLDEALLKKMVKIKAKYPLEESKGRHKHME